MKISIFRKVETAKIKVLQIITKSSTAFTNMMLVSWKKNFEHKIRYWEQCLEKTIWGIFWYKKVLLLKSIFLLYRGVRKWQIQNYCHYFCFYDFDRNIQFSQYNYCIPNPAETKTWWNNDCVVRQRMICLSKSKTVCGHVSFINI